MSDGHIWEAFFGSILTAQLLDLWALQISRLPLWELSESLQDPTACRHIVTSRGMASGEDSIVETRALPIVNTSRRARELWSTLHTKILAVVRLQRVLQDLDWSQPVPGAFLPIFLGYVSTAFTFRVSLILVHCFTTNYMNSLHFLLGFLAITLRWKETVTCMLGF